MKLLLLMNDDDNDDTTTFFLVLCVNRPCTSWPRPSVNVMVSRGRVTSGRVGTSWRHSARPGTVSRSAMTARRWSSLTGKARLWLAQTAALKDPPTRTWYSSNIRRTIAR